jgi:hypothetical protein
MQPATASRTVILAALGVFGIGWFKSAKAGEPLPKHKFVIGATVTFSLLFILADFEPEIAGPLSLAILTTDFFANGADILAYVNGESGEGEEPKPAKTKTKAKTKPKIAHPKADIGQIPGLK